MRRFVQSQAPSTQHGMGYTSQSLPIHRTPPASLLGSLPPHSAIQSWQLEIPRSFFLRPPKNRDEANYGGRSEVPPNNINHCNFLRVTLL